MLMHILRYERINDTTSTLYFNPWQLSLTRIFPDIQFTQLANISNLFTSTSTRIIFVRHPFERLASAYKERIAILPKDRIEPQPLYNNLRREICYVYMPSYPGESFSSKHQRCEEYIPSFEYFARYIIRFSQRPNGLARMDPHWKPYSTICQACKFHYNFIGKYETFTDDFNTLLTRLGISDWKVQKRRGASGLNRSDYQEMLSNLSDELICQLKKLYNEDLELFQYRIEDMIKRQVSIC